MMLVADTTYLYQCTSCGKGTAPAGSCRHCGCPSEVDGSYTRRRAKPKNDRLLTLGHNIAVVGGLFVAFRAGDNFGFHMGEDSSQCTCQWSPGRGLPYAGPTRCESDCDDYDYGAERVLYALGPNGCTCGHNGDCNCPFEETA